MSPTHDLPGNVLPGNGASNDRRNQLFSNDRRKQGRRNFDRRNEDRRNQGRRHLAVYLLLATLALLLWNSGRHREATSAPPADASTQSPAPAPVTAPASRPTQPSRSGGTISAASPTVEEDTASAAPATPPGTLSLLIRAEETTRISIVADGKPVAQETLIAPAHTSVRARREIVVKTRNAAGVSFLLNGREIPAQGNEGEVKTYVFDEAGVRVMKQ
jgi:Domain of unknown function (DUF4115)